MTAAIAPSMPPILEWIRDIARRWRWRTSAFAVLIGAATLFNAGVPIAFPPSDARQALVELLYNVLQFGFPLVFAVLVADRAVDRGVSALWAYALAVILTGQAGVWIFARLLWPILGKAAWWGIDDDLTQIGATLLLHGLGVGAYAQWRGGRVARERLQADERDRAIAQRRLIASRLLALQARVDPQLLFDALGRIDAALVSDAGLADRQLADLISLLRAMQPTVQQRASTLQRELALLEAQARVSAAPGQQPALLHVEVSDAASRTRLAPLVLLPLLRWLATLHPSGWRIGAIVTGHRLIIDIATTDGSAAALRDAMMNAADIDEPRQRLIAVHGSNAVLRADPESLRLFIEVDAEYDEHPDR